MEAVSPQTDPTRGTSGGKTRCRLRRQPRAGMRDGVLGKELYGCLPQIRAREHHRQIPPPFVADDGDPLDGVAVGDVKSQVVPVANALPSPEVLQNAQQLRRADTIELDLQLVLGTREFRPRQNPADVQP